MAKVKVKEANNDLLRAACENLTLAVEEITSAKATVGKSGYVAVEKVQSSLDRVNVRLNGLVRKINPDAAAEREKARKGKRIARLEKRLEEMRAEIA